MNICGTILLKYSGRLLEVQQASTNLIEIFFTNVSWVLDASKAFDKIHFGKLFKTLISKNLPPLIIRLILNSYIRQETCVSYMSSYFRLAIMV